MNDYYSVRVDATPCSDDICDLAAAFLADAGFESFEPDTAGLTAYIAASVSDNPATLAAESLSDFPMNVKFEISDTFIKGEDWNEEWEKHYFKPIVISDRCVVHSTFHKDAPKAEFEIVIDPKMAFGTGHHDTTSQMVQHILEADISGKSVIDMGTGTGILAILAAMRGASNVTGIEIDPPAWENAVENAASNGVKVDMILGDASKLEALRPADFLFANINRNIILQDIEKYASRLVPGGTMLLSGFYEEDIPMILEAAAKCGLSEAGRKISNRWTALKLHKGRL